METTGYQAAAVVGALTAPSVIAQAAHVEIPVSYAITAGAGLAIAVIGYFVKREIEDTRTKRRIDRAKIEALSDTVYDLKTKLAVLESRLSDSKKE